MIVDMCIEENKISSKRKDYMWYIYSKNWSNDRKAYGIQQYDKDLIFLLLSSRGQGKVLEVGIGDGFP